MICVQNPIYRSLKVVRKVKVKLEPRALNGCCAKLLFSALGSIRWTIFHLSAVLALYRYIYKVDAWQHELQWASERNATNQVTIWLSVMR